MIKLYRRLRKWVVLLFWNRTRRDKCRDCLDEAKADCGLYWRDDIPPEKEKQFYKAYHDEYYFAHLDPWGWNAKVRVR